VVPAVVAGSLAFDAHILFTDRQGHHWVGTERGVTKFVSNPGVIQTFTAFPDSPCNGCVPLGVRKGADNQFYLSFFLVPNIYKLDAKKNEWVLFSDRLNTGPWCMNSAGAELVFTGGQTMRYATFDPRTGEIKFSSDFLKKYFPAADILILAFQHSNGDRWFSANKGGGFVRIEAKDGRIQHYTKDGPQGKFTHGYYSRYAEDRFGNLWFSVNKTPRLLRWEKISDRFSEVSLDTVPGAEGISFRGVNDIALDQEDKLWVGYDGTGLAQYDYERNQLIHYSRLQGLPSDYVTALALDGTNRVWINTHNGLSCLLPEENRIRNFTQADGLAEDRFINGFVSFDSTSNLVWVGGLSSVMRFNPDTLLALTTPAPSIYIDELYVNGKQRELSDKGTMRLLQNENSVQFRFVAVTTTSKPLQFRYLLEGHDAHWIENTPGTVVSYSNLEPGSYTFQVRARFHGDDKILYSATPLSFVVATPFFRTEWFRVSVALAGTFTLLSLFRLYYAKKHEKERFQLGQQHAVEKERTRIALDMHDDFGASLSRIKFISEKLKITGHLPSDLGVYLDKISKYSDEMAEKMNEIVWALNERYDTVSDLVSFSRAYAADYLNQHHIKLDFQSTEKPELKISGEARRNIFLVMKEALHNTVKHAEASHVCISIHIDHNILFTISDNGKGVTLNSIRPFANGLVNMRKRTEAVGGVFEIENAPVGTTIKIEVPL
jgi:signal transduction histidine kinase/streptogramin lyase